MTMHRRLQEVTNLDALLIQHQKLGRLRVNTTFNSSSVNTLLADYAPNTRVLSGETIIF